MTAPDPFSLKAGLARIAAAGLRRTRQALDSAQGATVSIKGRRLINFCSNDYLALAQEPRLAAALRAGLAAYGLGSGASPLVCGRNRAHEELEEAVAAHLGRARALLFSSGYLANLAVVSAFASRRDDTIVMDKANHASLVDGALLARGRLRRYGPHDLAGLERLCAGTGRVLVATDSVFSMDGSLAALPAIAAICARRGAWLVVDDAHGFGVLGPRGGGALEHFDLDENQAPLTTATFGKACGVMGAFAAGAADAVETLVQRGRPYIYSTAMPPALAVAAREALAIVERETWRREKLRALTRRFTRGAKQLGLPLLPSATPIQGFMVGNAGAAVRCSQRALAQGLLLSAIRSPTVPKNTERLRITLTAGHSEEQVDRLLDALAELAATLVPQP